MAGGEDTSGDDNDIVYYVHIAMVVLGVDIPYSWIETKKTSAIAMNLLDNKNYKVMVRVHPQPDSVYSSRWSAAASFTTIEAIAKPCSLGESTQCCRVRVPAQHRSWYGYLAC